MVSHETLDQGVMKFPKPEKKRPVCAVYRGKKAAVALLLLAACAGGCGSASSGSAGVENVLNNGQGTDVALGCGQEAVIGADGTTTEVREPLDGEI